MSEALRQAKQRYYYRNKEGICLQEQVKYWENADSREKKRQAAKQHYYQRQIEQINKALADEA